MAVFNPVVCLTQWPFWQHPHWLTTITEYLVTLNIKHGSTLSKSSVLNKAGLSQQATPEAKPDSNAYFVWTVSSEYFLHFKICDWGK